MSNPARDFLQLLANSERLEALPRTGWITSGVHNPESIAAHSYQVCIAALWIADQIEEEVDVEKVLRIALLHDLPEALLGDLPRPVKERIGSEICAQAEQDAATDLFGTLPKWIASFQSYQRAESLEARIVKAADKLQMALKAHQYMVQKRGDTRRFLKELGSYPTYDLLIVEMLFAEIKVWVEEDYWPEGD